jgi:hypothetical protein
MTASEWLSYDDNDAAGAPAVVDFDAALEGAERPAYAHRIDLTVRGFTPDADGLPVDAAEDQLYGVERQLEALLGDGGVIAVSVASGGSFTWHAYARDASHDADLESAARESGLATSLSGADDPQWQTYARYALVGEELECARDCEQLEELSNEGVDLSVPREIDFDYEFPDPQSAAAAYEAFTDEDDDRDRIGGHVDGDVTIHVPRVVVPTPDAIRLARIELNALFVSRGGTYAGWGMDPDGDYDVTS